MSNETWWDRHRKKVHVGFEVLSVIIFSSAAWAFTNKVYLTVASAFFGPFLIRSIVNMADFNVMYPKMREHIVSVLGSLKDVAFFLDEAHRLDEGKKRLSVSLANTSLKSLTEKGFLEVDVDYYAFLDHIKDLGRETNVKIFGTAVIRQPIEHAMDTFSKNYLKVLLEKAERRLVRVTVLNDRDVEGVVERAVENLQQGSGSPPTTGIYDIPEIQWWVAWANQVSYSTPDERQLYLRFNDN